MTHHTDKDAIVSDIMEAGLAGALGAAGVAAGKTLGRAALAAGKAAGGVALDKLDKNNTFGRISGGIQAGRALTKIQNDWSHYAGAHGIKRGAASTQDLLDFAKAAYGIEAHAALAKAMSNLKLNAQPAQSNSAQPQQTAQAGAEQGEQPQAKAEPQADAQAAPEANPAAGRAKKTDAPAEPATQAEPEAQAEPAGPKVVGQPGKKYRRADGTEIDPNDVVATPPVGKDGALHRDGSQSVYKHDSSGIDFDNPEFQKPLRSSAQQKDDQRQGRGKKGRNESLELDLGTFSQILAERETTAVNSQTVPDAKQQAALADEFFKVLARTAASTPQIFKAFMNNEKNLAKADSWDRKGQASFQSLAGSGAAPSGNAGQAKPSAAKGSTGQQGDASAPPNNSTATTIDKTYLNHVLTNDFGISAQKLGGLKQMGQKLSPEDLLKALRQELTQDECLKVIAAVLLADK